MEKEVELFNGNFEYTLTDLPGVKFLDAQEEIDMKVDTKENEGTDGGILGSATFGPFDLFLNISYKGNDAEDVRLIKQKLRSLLFRRDPYYIWHSDTPQKRYAVYCEALDSEDLTNSFSTFEITFVVYKGFSESLKSTKDIDFLLEDIHLSEDRSVEDYGYAFNRSRFVIYNAGDVTVDPREHYLNIKIEGSSDGELTINNKTTKERFIYKPTLRNRTGDWLEINGVYPKKNGINCGIDTNHGLISLVPGINKIEIQNANEIKTSWDFYFLYK
ncbi:distal tail protein Dit [Tetragenococcus halophilus]|uniref:distal tail protein Dit n=1 Tax=Tetragenococcus halophilus TaxID=51669 RepID=UPI0030C922D7